MTYAKLTSPLRTASKALQIFKMAISDDLVMLMVKQINEAAGLNILNNNTRSVRQRNKLTSKKEFMVLLAFGIVLASWEKSAEIDEVCESLPPIPKLISPLLRPVSSCMAREASFMPKVEEIVSGFRH